MLLGLPVCGHESSGSGGWNENTYASNMRSRISFFKAFPGPKAIWRNETIAESEANFRKLCQL